MHESTVQYIGIDELTAFKVIRFTVFKLKFSKPVERYSQKKYNEGAEVK